MNALLEATLGYAARGIPVYPVHWPHLNPGEARTACSCRHRVACDRPAKHPLVRHGIHDATCDPGQLERLWSRWPQANLGLATGIMFDALDIDWGRRPGRPPPARTSGGPLAPRPGRADGGVAGTTGFAPTGLGNRPPRGLAHVDWRGIGGCVLAPPSRHASGRTYRWVRDLDQAPLPEVPAAELATLGRATPGQRNHTLNQTAFKVYRYVAGGLLTDEEVTAAFSEAALAIGLDPVEVSRTLASARSAGLDNPRTVPAGPDPNSQEDGP